MACWNDCDCCRRDRDRDRQRDINIETRIEDSQFLRNKQKQQQDQDQDQDQKSVFKEIGNVNIKIENGNIEILFLILLDLLSGALDLQTARARVENLIKKQPANTL